MICPTCKRAFDPSRASDPTRDSTPARTAASPPAPARNAPVARPDGPFCSARCRLADLGSWLDGAYRIPASSDGGEEALELAAAGDEPDPIN